MIIKCYSEDFQIQWDDFVKNAKNSHFMFERDFMEYHSDRFVDNSLMFYKEGELMAVLPANIKDGVLYSHAGLTFGGLLHSKDISIMEVLEIFNILKGYAITNNISKLIYKRLPHIFHSYPADEDLYALFRNDAKLLKRELNLVIDLSNPAKLKRARRRNFLKSVENKIEVKYNDDYQNFYEVLNFMLQKVHQVSPVHSLKEIKLLTSKFPQNIKLICAYKDAEFCGGGWIFTTQFVTHLQYVTISENGRTFGTYEAIMDFIQNNEKQRYISFGISTENNGRRLNEGLVWIKEAFGARAITHDFYEITF